MSDFHNAFKAFLATPGSDSPKEGGGESSATGEESPRPPPPPAGRRGRAGGVVVKAPSPEVEIPSTAIRLDVK